MIHRAKFQNFKALRDVEVTFDSRLTVLVGPNGSGKTSILQGIHFLTQLAAPRVTDQEYDLAKLGEYYTIGAPRGQIYLVLHGERVGLGEYQITIDTAVP